MTTDRAMEGEELTAKSAVENGRDRTPYLPPGWPEPFLVEMPAEGTAPEVSEAPAKADTRPTGLPPRSSALLMASALLGAVLGGLVSGQVTPDFTAVALVQGSPARLNPSTLSQEDDRYAQTEAAYARLAEAEVADALAERLAGGARPAEVSVVPGTTILRFTGAGSTAEAAADAANISAETYVTGWRNRTTDALTASLEVIDAALASPADNSDSLTEQRAELDAQLATVQAVERVVEPATADKSQHTSGIVSGSLLGALAGATAGLAGLLWHRRSTFEGVRVL